MEDTQSMNDQRFAAKLYQGLICAHAAGAAARKYKAYRILFGDIERVLHKSVDPEKVVLRHIEVEYRGLGRLAG
jgi:hypothetical protein